MLQQKDAKPSALGGLVGSGAVVLAFSVTVASLSQPLFVVRRVCLFNLLKCSYFEVFWFLIQGFECRILLEKVRCLVKRWGP